MNRPLTSKENSTPDNRVPTLRQLKLALKKDQQFEVLGVILVDQYESDVWITNVVNGTHNRYDSVEDAREALKVDIAELPEVLGPDDITALKVLKERKNQKNEVESRDRQMGGYIGRLSAGSGVPIRLKAKKVRVEATYYHPKKIESGGKTYTSMWQMLNNVIPHAELLQQNQWTIMKWSQYKSWDVADGILLADIVYAKIV